MEIQEKPRVNFRWEKSTDRYMFRSEQKVRGNPDQLNAEIEDILRWCRDQRLKPDEYRFAASRRTLSEKFEQFEISGRSGAFEGGTTFHPAVVSVELDLPKRLGPMFSLAFSVSDERR